MNLNSGTFGERKLGEMRVGEEEGVVCGEVGERIGGRSGEGRGSEGLSVGSKIRGGMGGGGLNDLITS